MKIAQIHAPCECQGRLSATIDAEGRVLCGQARMGKGPSENAPATGMNVGKAQFRVGWLCPLCGRNTVRSFERGALVFVDRASV